MSEVLGRAIDLDQTPLAYPPLQTLFPLCLVAVNNSLAKPNGQAPDIRGKED